MFARSNSGVAELTEAELLNVAGADGALTVMVMSAVLPTARLAMVQVTVAVPLQLQPVPLALTNVTLPGRMSLTLTAEAGFGPALLTLSV